MCYVQALTLAKTGLKAGFYQENNEFSVEKQLRYGCY